MIIRLIVCCIFILTVAVVEGQNQCAWEIYSTTWNSGRKVVLSIPVQEIMDDWSIHFLFNSSVQMESWRGDVYKLNNNEYNVTNKCYNGRLYPCQCLELGYLLRFQSGEAPIPSISFNSVTLPMCDSEPDCSGEESSSTLETAAVTASSLSTTQVSTSTAPPTTVLFSTVELHPCLASSSPCHPDALCLPTGNTSYNCECPTATTHTGEDLNNPLSTVPACVAGSSSTNLTNELTNVNDSIKLLSDMFVADPTFTVLLNVFLQDNSTASVEDFVATLVDDSLTLGILTAAVGADSSAIQAVVDVLGSNTNSVDSFLLAVSAAGFSTPDFGFKYRAKRSISTALLKVYINFFYEYIRILMHYLDTYNICELLQILESIIYSETNCVDMENALKSLQKDLDIDKIISMLRAILKMNEYITLGSTFQLFQAGIFTYIRAIIWLRNLIPCIGNLYLVGVGENMLCLDDLCCTSPSICTVSNNQAICSCSMPLIYNQNEGCVTTTVATSTSEVSTAESSISVTTKDTSTVVTNIGFSSTNEMSTSVLETKTSTLGVSSTAEETQDTSTPGISSTNVLSTSKVTTKPSTLENSVSSTPVTTQVTSTPDITNAGISSTDALSTSEVTKEPSTLGSSTEEYSPVATYNISTTDVIHAPSMTKEPPIHNVTNEGISSTLISTPKVTIELSTQKVTNGGIPFTNELSTSFVTKEPSTQNTNEGLSSTNELSTSNITKEPEKVTDEGVNFTSNESTEEVTDEGNPTNAYSMESKNPSTHEKTPTMESLITETTYILAMNTNNSTTLPKTTMHGETPIFMPTNTSTKKPDTTIKGETPIMMYTNTTKLPKTTMKGETPIMMYTNTTKLPKTTMKGETPIMMYTNSTKFPKTTMKGETPIMMYTNSTKFPETTKGGEIPIVVFTNSTK